MRGVIARVDTQDNSAILVDDTKRQFVFSLDDCIGFEEYPEVGEQVSFDLTDGEIFFVEPLKDNVTKERDEEAEGDDDIIAKPSSKSSYKRPQKEKFQIQEKIPLSKNVQACLDNYFEDVVEAVYEYEAEFEEEENLDYIRMKRFLETAFNNLKDMDSSFMDDDLMGLYDDLKALEKVYLAFRQRNSAPQVAYDRVFLSQQDVYQKYLTRFESNSHQLSTLKSSTQSLEEQIKEIEKQIRLSSNKASQKKQEDLKRYKKYYVDSLHHMANLRDENIKIKKALSDFEARYEDEFVKVYKEEAVQYDLFLREQLNGYAYEFDKRMWEKAETSSAIRSFFRSANIEEDYSSKTFLKYFIKTLDSTKFSKEHKKLNELLAYLESRAKMRILIISEDAPHADKLKHIIRKFDKEYSVEKSDKPRSSYYRKDLKHLDFIFADYNMSNPFISEFIEMMTKRIKQANSKAKLAVFSNNFTKEALILLKTKGIERIIATNVGDNELQSNLKEIVMQQEK